MTDWLEMPTSQYNPMYASNNEYLSQYTWAVDSNSGSAIPLDVNYYRDAFKNGTKAQMKVRADRGSCSHVACLLCCYSHVHRCLNKIFCAHMHGRRI